MGSDGLWDNLSTKQILDEVSLVPAPSSVASNTTLNSFYIGPVYRPKCQQHRSHSCFIDRMA